MKSGRVGLLLAAAFTIQTAGCAEKLLVRSTPAGADVAIDGKPVGTTPVVYQTRNVRPLKFRVEKAGYPPVEGTVGTRVGGGRVTGAIFTLGILAMIRPMSYFTPNPLDVPLGAEGPPVVALRLYEVKTATVLQGECTPNEGRCSLTLPSGARCSGDFVREDQGTTTITQTTSGVRGSAVGGGTGGFGAVDLAANASAVGAGKQVANMNKAVTVLRCGDSLIDCSLVVDASGARGHGECTDTKGRAYRLLLMPVSPNP